MEMANIVRYFLFLIPNINGQIFGCDLCYCNTGLKFVECAGLVITYWPPFPIYNNTMVRLSFIGTSITTLPDIKSNEYKNLTSLYLYDNNNLKCAEIIEFELENENINVVYDNVCGLSTRPDDLTTPYLPYITTETNNSNTVTDENEDNLDGNESEAIWLAIGFLTILGIAIGLGFTCIIFVVRFCLKKCKCRREHDLDLSDIIFQMDNLSNESEL